MLHLDNAAILIFRYARETQTKKGAGRSRLRPGCYGALEIINANFSLSTNTRGRTTNFLKQPSFPTSFHLPPACEIFAIICREIFHVVYSVLVGTGIKIQKTSSPEGISFPPCLRTLCSPLELSRSRKHLLPSPANRPWRPRSLCIPRSPYRLKSYLKYVYVGVTTGMTPWDRKFRRFGVDGPARGSRSRRHVVFAPSDILGQSFRRSIREKSSETR